MLLSPLHHPHLIHKFYRFNLKNVEDRGAGVMLPKDQWNAENIYQALRKVLSNSSYKDEAVKIQNEMKSINGAKNAANAVLDYIL